MAADNSSVEGIARQMAWPPVEGHGVRLSPHDLLRDEAEGAAEGKEHSHGGDELPHPLLPRLQDQRLLLDAHHSAERNSLC